MGFNSEGEAMTDGRDENGRFTAGNPGGPGRPRRATERQYLVALADALTLDHWREIVRRAVQDATDGDAKAREWLGRFALGAQPLTFAQLAALEHLGITDAHMVRAEAEQYVREGDWFDDRTPAQMALDLLKADEAAAERERRRLDRAARKAALLAAPAAEDGAESADNGSPAG